ncbi:unnamed protein product [Calicophoron daubneyi]|uniref:beta-mannosidase n=1 Tax=Calicophoron daubneyi TaxID=300641 RepID=A0AAV2TSE9_CALDB
METGLLCTSLIFYSTLFLTGGVLLDGKWYLLGNGHNLSFQVRSGMDTYSVLWKNGVIKNPLSEMHDTEYRFLSRRNWTFTHSFLWKNSGPAELHWDGIDLFCDAVLNGNILNSKINSFLRNRWLVTQYLREKDLNKLELRCQSSPAMAEHIAENMKTRGKQVPPPRCWPGDYHGECHVNLIRTTQASFAWDWGPAFPVQGFWNPPELISTKTGLRFGRGFKFFAIPEEDSYTNWTAIISAEVEIPLDSSNDLGENSDICIKYELNDAQETKGQKCGKPIGNEFTMTMFTNNDRLDLWWPNGIQTGPRLYTLDLYLSTPSGGEMDHVTHLVGFRKVELIENKVSSTNPQLGLSFYFRLNGVPVFAKGANWIPARLLPGGHAGLMDVPDSGSDGGAKRLLRSAALAGVNMIRIWGGGRYEPDEFYEEADKLGLMIWHDMMFAVSTYAPKDESSPTDSVEEEIREHIRRLHSHPSIVVWSTDNEVKQAIDDNWYGTKYEDEIEVYVNRFVNSIARIVNEEERLNTTSLYVPRRCLISSPSNGIITEMAGGRDRGSQSKLYGDMHYYVYNGNMWEESRYAVSRFTSEFGIQSLPSALAWRRALDDVNVEAKWNVTGSLMGHRQHHSSGYAFYELAAGVIGKPGRLKDPIATYSRWAYITQLNQMMSYRAHINLLMRHQCRFDSKLSNLTPTDRTSMGAIYWQLNDVWSAPTWSTVDAAGLWKMAHYGAVRECFNTRSFGRIAIHAEFGYVEADWIPDVQFGQKMVTPESFTVLCYTIRSFKPTASWMISVDWSSQKPNCPVPVLKEPIESIRNLCKFDTGIPDSECLLHIRLNKHQGTEDRDSSFTMLGAPVGIAQWPKYPRESRFKLANIVRLPLDSHQYDVPFLAKDAYRFTISSESPELFVWLELDSSLDVEYWFSENAFNLLTKKERTVEIYASSRLTVEPDELQKLVKITSLSTMRESTPDVHHSYNTVLFIALILLIFISFV